MTAFYDTHAHLDFPDLLVELPVVLERASQSEISKVITIGTDLASSVRCIEISEQYSQVYAAVGWHPCQALDAPDDFKSAFRSLARHPKVVAIGETGLDHHRLPGNESQCGQNERTRLKQKQELLFRQHLELAAEEGLNCVVHQRDAFDDCLSLMQEFEGKVRGVFHCFVDSSAAMRKVLDVGSLVSFTGIVTFKNAVTVRECLAATPMDGFMLETDAPYLAPVPFRGKRCEPAFVEHIAATIAEIKKCSLEDLSLGTCQNAERFFPKLVY